ncbi:PLAC8 family-domain-containing protein [Protomyces lactucae-debilis]|uniref:PLAC8 family-domain-containing protein n=1 Tax=Protomyces lactucae-debilis TaxID=2754530 RepID=A0A1Y2EWU1_PROLT|nr:PLAC8 family-domain-containing protein [Protomyces lactucae-debilis]ORY76049.1 PLAC8 family-domain-containing protein [Protomyces lactucae-debilis]
MNTAQHQAPMLVPAAVHDPAAPVAAAPAPVAPMSQAANPSYTEKSSHAAPMTQGGVGTAAGSDWTQGFCECLNPIDLCVTTFFCPCITYGRLQERAANPTSRQQPEMVNAQCGLYGALLCCAGFQWVLGCMGRTAHRERMGIEGSTGMDCASHFCCSCCALIQETKEMDHRYGQLEG